MARNRIRRTAGVLLAAPLAAGLLLAGAGAAAADNGALANDGSNSGVVSNVGTGNVFGSVDGNYISTQQTATGSGASNQANTLAVKDNSGTILAGQSNKNYSIVFAPIFH
ncbi:MULTISPECIES: hypothetical protein [unclassified Streptomyces]|uniref:hypothetical protein n=1 Tax=Streptomycetaceae TaxID=2062 RepID=UPI0005F98D62|nr:MULTISPECIES: hypothetical protein [unclassified Streptomyces]KJY38056.1 hypothetical protein VR45_06985 [Streptomyces sp. NRRL S-495]KOV36502.1 hypothetical protein ADK60_06935 [Streptomyces sp. XY431]